MTRESTLDEHTIREQFRELAGILEDEVTVYLIRGGALTLQDLKSATKDIDLIVRGGSKLARLKDALEAEGYREPESLTEEYDELEAAFIVENGIRRFDVFNQQVAGVLVLSEAMVDRSRHLFDIGPLSVRMISLDDIFLFKAVANRDDDVDDMVTLAQAGVDDTIILEEVKRQLSILADDGFIRSMKYKMERLSDGGYDFDIQNDIEDLHESSSAANDVIDRIRVLSESEYNDELYQGVPQWRIENDLGEESVQVGVTWLQRLGKIESHEDGTLSLIDD